MKPRKYDIDSDYFEIIDTEEKAYWLGFLYADGYVRIRSGTTRNGMNGELKLKLHQKDRKHIELFRKCLKSTHKIKDGMSIVKVNDREYKCYYSTLSIYSIKLVRDLFDKGCINNKTFKLKFPEWLREDLIRHFIRGYFDGDGCISINKKSKNHAFSIIGTFKFLTGIGKYFKLNNINNFKISKLGSVYNLITTDKPEILKIKNIFYNGSKVYLNRKKKKFDEIVDNYVKFYKFNKFIETNNLTNKKTYWSLVMNSRLNNFPRNPENYYVNFNW